MTIKNRLERLEQAVGTNGPQEVIIMVSWDEVNRTTDPHYLVDGERMTEAEFNRRWPNYQDDGFEVIVNWDEPRTGEKITWAT